MVTVPPVMPASESPPVVSLNRTLPTPLVAAKEVTVLDWVLRVMAEERSPLTVKAPALTAAD